MQLVLGTQSKETLVQDVTQTCLLNNPGMSGEGVAKSVLSFVPSK